MSLHVETLGQGPDLVMVHGWGMHGGVWGPVRDALAASFRLHLIDLPGLGHSCPITPYVLEGLTGEIAYSVPETVAVCGWSLGGQVAMRWALDRPNQISKLVLVGTTPKFINDEGWTVGIAAETFRQFASQVQQDYRGTLSKFLALQAHGGDASKETVRRLRDQFFLRGEPSSDALQSGLDILLQTDLRDEIEGLKTPTMILHGDCDRLAPPEAGTWLAHHLPSAQLRICKGSSHAPFISHPAWFTKCMEEFLLG